MKHRAKSLRFTPLAWLKWQFLCHAGPTEVAGFGLSAADDLLLVEDVLVCRQRATSVTVAFNDHAVADMFDTMVDVGIRPERFARIWLHTHPGASVEPSHTDEMTFRRVFGNCDWAVMAILGRTGRTSSRLRFSAGPGWSSPSADCCRLATLAKRSGTILNPTRGMATRIRHSDRSNTPDVVRHDGL